MNCRRILPRHRSTAGRARASARETAARVAAELKKDLDLDATLVAGSNGIFDVTLDGKKVFSKKEIGRFPDAGEVTETIRAGMRD